MLYLNIILTYMIPENIELFVVSGYMYKLHVDQLQITVYMYIYAVIRKW